MIQTNKISKAAIYICRDYERGDSLPPQREGCVESGMESSSCGPAGHAHGLGMLQNARHLR